MAQALIWRQALIWAFTVYYEYPHLSPYGKLASPSLDYPSYKI